MKYLQAGSRILMLTFFLLMSACGIYTFNSGFYGNKAELNCTAIHAIGGQVLLRGYHHRIILPVDGLFVPNTDELRPQAYAALAQAAKLIHLCECSRVDIFAYADNIQNIRLEKSLTRKRAKRVLSVLWAQGVPDIRLHAQGKDRYSPVAWNNRLTGYALNRRIEIIF